MNAVILTTETPTSCPTAINGLNRINDDLFNLKRVFVS